MTVARALLILLMLVVIGVTIVGVRSESAKAANRIQRLHQTKVTIRQEMWSRELELAKLRGPEAIRKRAAEMELDVVPPAKANESDKATKDKKPNSNAADRD
ncbi:MAG: hypothetical protein IPK83_22285 [Planctomycetes bacterium]|nr:hypothetical protein [Planctomycetota bacterium]